MPFGSNSSSEPRWNSELDRHAIGLVGRLLIVWVWLERQLAMVPNMLTNVVAESRPPRPTLRLVLVND
jgi:hypothetical protein